MAIDGPHRSLPMRPSWKRAAKDADTPAFSSEEVGRSLLPALEQDWREEVPPGFIERIKAEFEDSLFRDQVGGRLEDLRSEAGHGLGRSCWDHLVRRVAGGDVGVDAPLRAATDALRERAARGVRQIEEHYCRKAEGGRARDVRNRLDEAASGADIEGLARRLVNGERRAVPLVEKQSGLDDGVPI